MLGILCPVIKFSVLQTEKTLYGIKCLPPVKHIPVTIKQILFLTILKTLAAILSGPIINYFKQGHACVPYNYTTKIDLNT